MHACLLVGSTCLWTELAGICLGWYLQTVGLVPDEGLQMVLPGWRASLLLDCPCVLLGRRQGGLAQSSSMCWQWRA
jgi:hypothetical protein